MSRDVDPPCNTTAVLRNTSCIMFPETAPVTSDPSDSGEGQRSQDVLLAGLLAGTRASMHAGY